MTSVGVLAPAEFTWSGSPVTTSGNITIAKANQNANLVYAGPASGAAATPVFRSLVAADMPVVDVAHGGTGGTTAAAARTGIGLGIGAAARAGRTSFCGTGRSWCAERTPERAGGRDGGGTGGNLTRWSGTGASSVLTNSIMTESGATVSVGGNISATGNVVRDVGRGGDRLDAVGERGGDVREDRGGGRGEHGIADGGVGERRFGERGGGGGEDRGGSGGEHGDLDGSVASVDLANGAVGTGKIGAGPSGARRSRTRLSRATTSRTGRSGSGSFPGGRVLGT